MLPACCSMAQGACSCQALRLTDKRLPRLLCLHKMVWRASKELGCGYTADCRMYVCRYAPAGNVLGQFQQNVG
jgi:hypothetical protein